MTALEWLVMLPPILDWLLQAWLVVQTWFSFFATEWGLVL